MTAPDTVALLPAFLDALPAPARTQLHATQTIDGLVHAAVRDHDWTIDALARECGRDLAGVANAGAVITHRLRHAAAHPPAALSGRQGVRVPLCGHCEDGFLVDPQTRLPARRCPCRSAS